MPTHERFVYGSESCSGETPGHECDLPDGHTTRHMCGECGLYFDGGEA